MNTRKVVLGSVLSLGLVTSGIMIGQQIGPRHPNLAEAQSLVERADVKLQDAQRANEFDMDGHAAKARELLGECNREIEKAAHHDHDDHDRH
jgi:hypothetical protein